MDDKKDIFFAIGPEDSETLVIEELLCRYNYDFRHVLNLNNVRPLDIDSGGETHIKVNRFADIAIAVKVRPPTNVLSSTLYMISHNKIDKKFLDKSPELFWEMSAIGQVVKLLKELDGTVVPITQEMRTIAASVHYPNVIPPNDLADMPKAINMSKSLLSRLRTYNLVDGKKKIINMIKEIPVYSIVFIPILTEDENLITSLGAIYVNGVSRFIVSVKSEEERDTVLELCREFTSH